MISRVGDRGGLAVAAALVVILLGAAAARFVDLSTNPGGLNPDEAAEAVSARQILRDPGYRPVFIIEDGGREALFAYSVAAGFAIAGDNATTLRAVAAIWGILGVLGAWLIARRFGKGAGLAAGAWAAGSLWLIAISRDGMRNTFTPFFLAIALVALLAWYDRPTRRTALLAGATLAISSLYTYQALKLLPFLVLIWVLWLRRSDLVTFRRLVSQGGWFVASFLIVGAPMIAFAISDPQNYLGRAIGVSAFNPAIVLESDIPTHVLRTLSMFAFVGDPNVRHNVASLPMLSWPLVIFAIAGLVVLWRRRNNARHALILLSIPVFLIPPLLSTEGGSPHFLRALGLAIPVAVAIGLGAQDLGQRFSVVLTRIAASTPRIPPSLVTAASTGAFAAVFLALGISSAWAYLGRPEVDRREAFRFDLVDMAEAARPADAVIASEFDAFTVEYIHDDPQPTIVRPGQPIASGAFDRVLAVRVEELRAALGTEAAATAVPVAWDPAGQPTVWAVTLR
ncbi:MAG: glycosyltransferase family 39 protein [Candidatus Limnocylindrales bacterium]